MPRPQPHAYLRQAAQELLLECAAAVNGVARMLEHILATFTLHIGRHPGAMLHRADRTLPRGR
eukprot:3908526-Karenia_brevis.AAC.1